MGKTMPNTTQSRLKLRFLKLFYSICYISIVYLFSEMLQEKTPAVAAHEGITVACEPAELVSDTSHLDLSAAHSIPHNDVDQV